MTTKNINDPKTPVEQVLKAADSGGVVVQSENKSRYAVLPLDDDLLDYLLEHNPQLIAQCDEIRSRMRSGHSITHEDVRRQLSGG